MNNRWQQTVFNLVTKPELLSPILWSWKAEQMLVSAFDHKENRSSPRLAFPSWSRESAVRPGLLCRLVLCIRFLSRWHIAQPVPAGAHVGAWGMERVGDSHSESRINPGPLQTTKCPRSFLLTLGKCDDSSAKIITYLSLVLLCSKGSQPVGRYPFGKHIDILTIRYLH